MEAAQLEAEAERQQEEAGRLSERRAALKQNPFDPRTEISADARHISSRIVTHLWIIFVLLPIVTVVLLAMLGVIK